MDNDCKSPLKGLALIKLEDRKIVLFKVLGKLKIGNDFPIGSMEE